MKTVFFESLRYKLITKNDFYYGSCPDIHSSIIIVEVQKVSYYFTVLRYEFIFSINGINIFVISKTYNTNNVIFLVYHQTLYN